MIRWIDKKEDAWAASALCGPLRNQIAAILFIPAAAERPLLVTTRKLLEPSGDDFESYTTGSRPCLPASGGGSIEVAVGVH